MPTRKVNEQLDFRCDDVHNPFCMHGLVFHFE